MMNRKVHFQDVLIGGWFEESLVLYKRVSENQAQNSMGVRVTFYYNDMVWV